MILETLKLNGSLLTRTFLFQTHKSSVFETCAKPYKKGIRNVATLCGFNVAMLTRPYVATSPNCDVGMSSLRNFGMSSRRDVGTSSRRDIGTSSRRDVGTSSRRDVGTSSLRLAMLEHHDVGSV